MTSKRHSTTPRRRGRVAASEPGNGASLRGRTAARLALLLVAVFVVKVIVALQLDKHPLLQPDTGLDTTAYVDLAKRVVAGDFALGSGLYYVSPLYIYFLALVYGITRSFAAARVLQAVLGTAAVALIFLTARDWFGRRAAWIAAGLAGLTGVFTYYEALILQSSLDVFLTSAALWLLTLALRREQSYLSLLAGFTFGVASLNRPNMLVPILAIVTLLVTVRRFRAAAIVIAGVIAGLAPVTARNIVVAHQWSLVSSHGGINFYIGNGEGATGYFHAVPGMRSTVDGLALDARRVAETALRRNLTDAEVSSYYSSLSWTWIRAHPAAWARLLLRKTYAVFNAAHVSTPFSYTFYAYDAHTLLRYCFIGPWLLVPLGVFGLLRAAPRPWRGGPYIVWLSFVPAYAASVVLFFVTERYKLPLYVALAIGAGAGAEVLLADFTARRMRRLAVSGCVVVALLVAANWSLHLDDGRVEERIRMAEYLANRGDVDEAERWVALGVCAPETGTRIQLSTLPYNRISTGYEGSEYPRKRANFVLPRRLLALASRADPAAVHLRVGAQYLNSEQAEPAINHLRRVEKLAPGNARAEYLLGHALLGAGRPAEAVVPLQRGIARHVDVPLAGYDLAVALQQTGDLAGAARALRAVKPPPSSSVVVWLQLGRRAAEVNAPDVAEPFFRRAVAVAPDLAQAHHLLGIDLLVLGRYEEAAAELTFTIQRQPRNADALAMLAVCEQHLGRLPEAREHAEAAIRLVPTHPLARQVQASLGGAR